MPDRGDKRWHIVFDRLSSALTIHKGATNLGGGVALLGNVAAELNFVEIFGQVQKRCNLFGIVARDDLRPARKR